MPIDVDWLYVNRIIKLRPSGKIYSAQVIAAADRLNELVRAGIPPVHTVIDGRDVEGAVDVGLGDMRKLISPLGEGVGWMVVIQHSVRDRFLTALGLQIAGARYKFAPNEEAALRMLLEWDPSLQDVVR